MHGLVGEDELLPPGVQFAVRLGVDDDPVGRGAGLGRSGGDGGDAPVGVGLPAEQRGGPGQRAGDEDDDPAGPVAAPGLVGDGYGPLGEPGELPQLPGAPGAEDQPPASPPGADGALVPEELGGARRGLFGADAPAALVADEAEEAPGGGGRRVLAPQAVPQGGLDGGGGVAGPDPGDPVRPARERDSGEPGPEAVLSGAAGAGGAPGGGVALPQGGGAPAEQGGGRRLAGRGRAGGGGAPRRQQCGEPEAGRPAPPGEALGFGSRSPIVRAARARPVVRPG